MDRIANVPRPSVSFSAPPARGPVVLPGLAVLLMALLVTGACTQQRQDDDARQPPYFASLRHDKSWGRRGPSYDQPVLWEYQRRGLPVLVIEQTPQWRKIVDPDGMTVWMHRSRLSTRAMAMVRAKTPAALYRSAGSGQIIIAYADPGALLRLGPCVQVRCQLKAGNIRGWVRKSALWGVDTKAAAKQVRPD